MRELVTPTRIREFMRRLGEVARTETRIYLTGGATALLFGWRETTVDVDLKIIPESDEVLRALPELKETLHLSVELASPDLFIPPVPGWESRSPFIVREGRVDWHHFDPCSQALSKIERGHERDRVDVAEMLRRGMVEPSALREGFRQIQADLIRYPAVDPKAFALKLEEALQGH
jgi:hypothetical protein